MGISLEVVRAYLKDLLPDYTFDEELLKEFYERNEELFRLGEGLIFNRQSLRIVDDVQKYFNCWWPIILVALKKKPDMELTVIMKETIGEEIGWTSDETGGMRKFRGLDLFRHSGELYTEGFAKMEGVVFLFTYGEDFYIKSPDGNAMRVWQRE